jgi:hypothetical protein
VDLGAVRKRLLMGVVLPVQELAPVQQQARAPELASQAQAQAQAQACQAQAS